MKTKKFLSAVIAVAFGLQGMSTLSVMAEDQMSAPTVVASDTEKQWAMVWSWERYEDGFSYHSDWNTVDGLSMISYIEKYNELKAVRWPTKDEGKTQSEASGEYKYAYRTDTEGKPVAYDETDTTSTTHLWHHQGRDSLMAKFSVGETVNDGRPIVVSYDYKIINTINQMWGNSNEPAASLSFMGFRMYGNQSKKNLTIKGSSTVNVAQQADADDWHSVKLVISPYVTDGRYKMEAVSVDGSVTKPENLLSSSSGKADADVYLDTITALMGLSYNNNMDKSCEYKNLTVTRGLESITATSSVADGETDVTPDNITVSFSKEVSLEDGAIKLYSGDTEVSSADYAVALADDNKTASIVMTNYKSRSSYKLVVDSTKVTGLMGEAFAEDLIVNFVTAKKNTVLTGSQSIAENAVPTVIGGADGQYFTSTQKTADGEIVMTVDNQAWADALKIEGKDKDGNTTYGFIDDGNGGLKVIGHAANGWGSSWNYAGIKLNGLAETENNGKPIVISYDYCGNNVKSDGNTFTGTEVLGESGNMLYILRSWSKMPTVTVKNNWIGVKHTTEEIDPAIWHSVQYVIEPDYNADGYSHISSITLDGNTIKYDDTALLSYTKNASATGSGDYITSLRIRVSRNVTDTDESGKLLPTVIRMKNFKVLRAEDFVSAIDDNVITASSPSLTVRFSDPVSESELAKLKVLKGIQEAEGAVAAYQLAADGMSASLTLNLSQTARYSLVMTDVEDIYGVKSSVDTLSFEYYNNTDGYLAFVDGQKTEADGNTTISFTLTSSKPAAVTPVVIAAAYDSYNRLIGVKTKDVTVTLNTDTEDSIVLDGIVGASSIQIMAWDSLFNMKPYCLAKEL